MTSSSNRPTRTLRPQIVKPRSSNRVATSASPRRARSLRELFSDAVASADAVTAGFEDRLAREAPWAFARGKAAAGWVAASARAVGGFLDLAKWDARLFAERAAVFLEVVRVTCQSSDETDASCALSRARLEIGLRGQEAAGLYLLGYAWIPNAELRARRRDERDRDKPHQFKPFPQHHPPLGSPRSPQHNGKGRRDPNFPRRQGSERGGAGQNRRSSFEFVSSMTRFPVSIAVSPSKAQWDYTLTTPWAAFYDGTRASRKGPVSFEFWGSL
jgi:hypothetical protein